MTSSDYSAKLTVEQIGKIPFFNGLEDDELEDLSSFLKVHRFKKGDLVIREGDKATSMYFIVEGLVKILKESYKNSEELVSYLKDQDYFGEMALLDGETRSASVIAESDLVITELEWDSFQQRFSDKPDMIIYVLVNIARTLSIRLRNTNTLYANLVQSFKSMVHINQVI